MTVGGRVKHRICSRPDAHGFTDSVCEGSKECIRLPEMRKDAIYREVFGTHGSLNTFGFG